MAAPSVDDLIQVRLITTKGIIDEIDKDFIGIVTAEVKAIKNLDKAESEFTMLEKSYIADLVAAQVLRYSLDRYKEDSKSTMGPDGVSQDAQDKLRYLQDMIDRFEADAKSKAVTLGTSAGSGGPFLVAKIRAGRSPC